MKKIKSDFKWNILATIIIIVIIIWQGTLGEWTSAISLKFFLAIDPPEWWTNRLKVAAHIHICVQEPPSKFQIFA